MLQAAYQALMRGDSLQAEQLSRAFLANAPQSEGALLALALALDAQMRTADALPCFERLTELFPATSAHWSNLGNAHRTLGNSVVAETMFDKAIALDGQDAGALFNRALLWLEKGEFHAARGFLLRAMQASPEDAGIRAETATTIFLCNDASTAEKVLEGWEQWSAADPLALADIGWLYSRLGQPVQAERALDRALAAAPDHPKTQLRRAAFLERSNRVEEATSILGRIDIEVAKREGLSEGVAVLRADLAARGDDPGAALQQYEAMAADAALSRRQPEILSAIARLHEKAGNREAAMEWLDRAHRIQVDDLRSHSPEWFEDGADPLLITRHRFRSNEIEQWIPCQGPSAEQSPIFVVGFPRSGTTMLETMLDAHPQLAGMDERTFLQDVVEAMAAMRLTYPDDLGRLDNAACDGLREVYWKLVRTRAGIPESKRLVDKNPLNMLRLPLISRLFPNAKIILALRHPCDVVLSNYMQTFRTPAYVALTATIASTARGYADAFDFWVDQANVLKPDVLELRYEDVVDDIDAQSHRIADFLEIPWDQRMVDFHVRAKERGYIATPSYQQVLEPINRKGVARWERYREYLDPTLAVLRPYMDRWNYSG